MDPTLQAIFAAGASFFAVTVVLAFIVALCKTTKERRSRAIARRNARCDSTQTYPVGESTSFDPSLNRISMPELLKATRNFAPDLIIGDGSFGLVYKATLSTGVTVAVKKLSPDAFQGFREFKAEMDTLGKIKHHNIVKILGFYASGFDRILIYEFIEKGCLDQWLYDTSSPEFSPLSWDTRVNIIKGVAKGLCFMHNLETPIIHRDIKASNVLLDSNFEAHIADFGLARRIEGSHSHVSTQVAGTMGYMPPEYFYGATMATVSGDIYSFGILMLEIATGRRPSWPFIQDDGHEIRLAAWATDMISKNRHMEIIDANIKKDDLIEDEVLQFFKIAIMCTSESYKLRPTTKEVVDLLDRFSPSNKDDSFRSMKNGDDMV